MKSSPPCAVARLYLTSSADEGEPIQRLRSGPVQVLNTHFPADPIEVAGAAMTLSLESWGPTLPRYLMWPEPPISPLR